MTISDAKRIYGDEDGYVTCEKCPIPIKCGWDCPNDCTGYCDAYRAIVRYMGNSKPTTEPTETPNDIINHPSHYCRDGGMESIDEMVLVFGKEAVKNFCLCNVWKYRYRSSTKNGEEDLKKSDWYMRKYSELCDE